MTRFVLRCPIPGDNPVVTHTRGVSDSVSVADTVIMSYDSISTGN